MQLTICIPNYNKANSLINLLNDLQNQTIKPAKIIICDDNSNKNELNLIKEYIKKSFLNIKLIENTKNHGMMYTINKLIDNVTTDYLTIFHNDDRASKFYIQDFTKVINGNKKYNIYTCNSCAIDDNLNLTNEFRINSGNVILSKNKSLNYLSKISFFIFLCINGTSIYKTSFIKKNKFYLNYDTEADLFSAINFLSKNDIYYLDKPLYFVTINSKTQSHNIRKNSQKLEKYSVNVLNILDYYYNKKVISFFYYLQYLSLIFFLQIKNKVKLKKIIKLFKLKLFYLPFFVFLIFYYFINMLIKKVKFMINKKNILNYLPN